MAQYFQVVNGNSTTFTLEDFRTLYSNTNNIQYHIINPEEAALQYHSSVIGIDQNVTTVQLDAYPQPVLLDSLSQQNVFVIDTVDGSGAQVTVQDPQQQVILTSDGTQQLVVQHLQPQQVPQTQQVQTQISAQQHAAMQEPVSQQQQQTVIYGRPGVNALTILDAVAATQVTENVIQKNQATEELVEKTSQACGNVEQESQTPVIVHTSNPIHERYIQLSDGQNITFSDWQQIRQQQLQLQLQQQTQRQQQPKLQQSEPQRQLQQPAQQLVEQLKPQQEQQQQKQQQKQQEEQPFLLPPPPPPPPQQQQQQQQQQFIHHLSHGQVLSPQSQSPKPQANTVKKTPASKRGVITVNRQNSGLSNKRTGARAPQPRKRQAQSPKVVHVPMLQQQQQLQLPEQSKEQQHLLLPQHLQQQQLQQQQLKQLQQQQLKHLQQQQQQQQQLKQLQQQQQQVKQLQQQQPQRQSAIVQRVPQQTQQEPQHAQVQQAVIQSEQYLQLQQQRLENDTHMEATPTLSHTTPRRTYSNKTRNKASTLVANNTVQAIASPNPEQQNLLDSHDNVISVVDPSPQASTPQPQTVVKHIMAPRTGSPAAALPSQLVLYLSNGQKQLLQFQSGTPPATIQDLKDLLVRVGLPLEADTEAAKDSALQVAAVQSSSVDANNQIVPQLDPVALAARHILGPQQAVVTQTVPAAVTEGQVVIKLENSTDSKAGVSEAPRYVQGMLAICQNCGFSSLDFNRCQRCLKKLQENVKAVPIRETGRKKVSPAVREVPHLDFHSSADNSTPARHPAARCATVSMYRNRKHRSRENSARRVSYSSPEGRESQSLNPWIYDLRHKLNEKCNSKPAVKSECAKRLKTPKKNRKLVEDPVVLTISSDEEDERRSEVGANSSPEKSCNNVSPSVFCAENAVTTAAMGKEPVIIEEQTENGEEADSTEEKDALNIEAIMDGTVKGCYTLLQCRTIRIGSYKVVPTDRVVVASGGLRMSVPSIHDEKESVTLYVRMQHIVKVLIHFGRGMPVLFFYLIPPAAVKIRNALGMDPKSGPFYDPASEDDTKRRITLLPERLNEDNKVVLKTIFEGPISGELNGKEANEILIRASPSEVQKIVKKMTPSVSPLKTVGGEVKTILIYPPPPAKGGIAINSDDYACLGEDQFLNDVIIDFYLRYLTLSVLSEYDQQRTHVFSSFFYKRLTTRPPKSARRSHPVEDDPKLSPAEKRHSRVKSWTKNVNLFEKDFIVIPINEHCHWFLAIICFPGLRGPVRMCDNSPVNDPAVKKQDKSSLKKIYDVDMLSHPVRIGSTTITPVKCADTINLEAGEYASDRDEAEGDDEEMEQGTSDEEEGSGENQPEEKLDKSSDSPPTTGPCSSKNPNIPWNAIKQPCILIFDSLAGASRSRVVATLRDYLSIENKVKGGEDRDFSKDTIKGASPKVPQQTNFTDCGLYLLQYVESFFKDPISNYHLPMKLLANWFPEEVVNRKRQDIQQLLLSLITESGVDPDSLNLPKLTFSDSQPPSELSSAETLNNSMEEESTQSKEDSGSSVPCKYIEEPEVSSRVSMEANPSGSSGSETSVPANASAIVLNENLTSLVNYSDDSDEKVSGESGESSSGSSKIVNTLSYLKSKRIERHLNKDTERTPAKKVKTDEALHQDGNR